MIAVTYALIYEVVRIDKRSDPGTRARRRQVRELRRKKKELEGILAILARYGPDSKRLQADHRKVVKLLRSHGYSVSRRVIRRLQNNVRYQRGIKEKFRASLIRSGKYLDKMEEIFQEQGLPKELTLLPHVESSFDYAARSRRGATGIWQFMRSTARRFLTINRYSDERLDPLKASEAAALLLRENYEKLGNWPLAITAFNHGTNGMLRAKKRHGSNLRKIIDEYKSRFFGFASKNFYAEFLAVVEVARDYERYFGPLPITEPLKFDVVPLNRAFHVSHFTKVPGLTESILQAFNPQLTKRFWTRSRILPTGVELRVPQGKGESVMAALAQAPPTMYYQVLRGDTLAAIADKWGTSVKQIQLENGIRNPHRIRSGQLLVIASASQDPNRYRVRWGDTLIEIARKFGTSLETLLIVNNISDRTTSTWVKPF